MWSDPSSKHAPHGTKAAGAIASAASATVLRGASEEACSIPRPAAEPPDVPYPQSPSSFSIRGPLRWARGWFLLLGRLWKGILKGKPIRKGFPLSRLFVGANCVSFAPPRAAGLTRSVAPPLRVRSFDRTRFFLCAETKKWGRRRHAGGTPGHAARKQSKPVAKP